MFNSYFLYSNFEILHFVYGWNNVSGEKTTLFTPGNCIAVLIMTFDKISIRADPPSVNPGTSENSSVNVPSLDKSVFKRRNFALGNSVKNHCCLSIAVRFHLMSSLIVSTRRFLLAGNIRYTARIELTFTCCSGDNF